MFWSSWLKCGMDALHTCIHSQNRRRLVPFRVCRLPSDLIVLMDSGDTFGSTVTLRRGPVDIWPNIRLSLPKLTTPPAFTDPGWPLVRVMNLSITAILAVPVGFGSLVHVIVDYEKCLALDTFTISTEQTLLDPTPILSETALTACPLSRLLRGSWR